MDINQEIKELMDDNSSSQLSEKETLVLDGIRYDIVRKNEKNYLVRSAPTFEEHLQGIRELKNKRKLQHKKYNQSQKGKERKAQYRQKRREQENEEV